MERLQLEYEEKCNELVESKNELKAAKMEIQELQILLKTQGDRRSSVIPDTMGTGASHAVGNPQAEELRRIFLWLSQQVVLENPIEYNANCDLVMAGQHVRMRHIVQWRLRDSDLRLTVPHELAPEISGLLAHVKMNPATMCEAMASAIIDAWFLSTSPAISETASAVTLLTHRLHQLSCVVANFPTPPAPPAQPMEQFADIAAGDIVEVNFEGEWFRGLVKLVENDGIAQVQCDADPPEVLTKTPLSFLRKVPCEPASPKEVPDITYDPAMPPREAMDPSVPPTPPPTANIPSVPQQPPPQES